MPPGSTAGCGCPSPPASRARYHCWSFDSRGHGDSDPAPGGDYDWEGFGRDALAVVDAVSALSGGFGRPLAVGHSSGGAALLLAEEARPWTFAALYCYEPVVLLFEGGGPELATENSLAEGARRRREVFASRAAALANYAAKAPFVTFDPAALDAYVEYGFHDRADGTVELSCPREHEARVYEQGWRHRAFARLDRVRCPVTLASGGGTAQFGVAFSQAIAARLSGPSAIEVHDELGHFGPMERPAGMAAAILAAFDGFDVLGGPDTSDAGVK